MKQNSLSKSRNQKNCVKYARTIQANYALIERSPIYAIHLNHLIYSVSAQVAHSIPVAQALNQFTHFTPFTQPPSPFSIYTGYWNRSTPTQIPQSTPFTQTAQSTQHPPFCQNESKLTFFSFLSSFFILLFFSTPPPFFFGSCDFTQRRQNDPSIMLIIMVLMLWFALMPDMCNRCVCVALREANVTHVYKTRIYFFFFFMCD